MDLEQYVLDNEPAIRLAFFLGVFAIIGLWEVVAPRRALTVSKALRWGSNLSLVILNTLLLRLVFPLAAGRYRRLRRGQRLGVCSTTSRSRSGSPCRWP